MKGKIENLKNKFLEEEKIIKNKEDLFKLEKKYLGRKGELNKLFEELKNFPPEKRKKAGKEINSLKEYILKRINYLNSRIKEGVKEEILDLTLPWKKKRGSKNPITDILEKIQEIFLELNFSIYESPHIETDFYNFSSLNIPKLHPARDMWNTFYLKEKIKNENLLLRTHTSSFQVRVLEEYTPPFRFINTGRCFRYEPIDRTHNIEFHQIDGFIIEEYLNFPNFIDIIYTIFEKLFDEPIEIKITPSYFPFTEPSFEVHIKRKKDKKFLEIMGAGFSHPNVLKQGKADPQKFKAIAFGMGIERIAMLYYGIKDIRDLYSQDLRILKNIK